VSESHQFSHRAASFSCFPAGSSLLAIVPSTTGENPVGGATGVQYTRRSADGKAQRRELASIRDREVDFGQVLTDGVK